MTDVFDVVVVGGRCAGAPLAVHLARQGLHVCVLDKARFPSDTASTHIVQPRGTAALDRLGVLGAARAAGAADIVGLTLQYGDARLDADFGAPGSGLSTGTTPGLSLRRHLLDALLLDAARDAGADVRTRDGVDGLLRDDDGRVCGVRVAGGGIRARVVVGADGRRSTVAAAVGAHEYAGYDAPRLASWGYFRHAGEDGHRLRIGRIGTTALIATPTDDDLLLVGVVPSVAERASFLADRDGFFAAEVRRWPELHGLLDGAQRVGPLRVIPDWHAYFRAAAGPGWVLTGDAGNFKDPAAAQGITDALRQAETLADAVATGLDGDLDAGLRAWWRWRDDDCRDMHWFARDMGAAGTTTPVMTEMVRDAARTDPLLLARVLNRDVPSTAVVTPRRVLRAATTALRARPASLTAMGREARHAAFGAAAGATGALRGRTLLARAARGAA